MTRFSSIVLSVALGVAMNGTPARAVEPEARAAVKPVCLSAAETREEINARKLVEPFAALKAAQTQYKAEPVSAKLCRSGDDLVYEIALLHRDGRYRHVVMNAATGKWLETRRPHEAQMQP